MKKIKCPLCEDRFNSIDGMYSHMEDEHSDIIPEDYSAARYAYLLRTGRDHGSCVVCKKDTEWNDVTNKYKRFCNNPKCKEAYTKQFRSRMISKYGKVTLLNEPEQQRLMLSHRRISGEYKWTDGTIKSYTGSYELDFLKMLDVFMNFDSDDIITPSPHTYYYMYENKKHFYIPDAFIPSLNLEIEIKDGLTNPNTHHKIQNVDKVKEKLKDAVMNSQRDYDYIKIMDKNYDGFFKYLLDRKAKEIGGAESIIADIVSESMTGYEFIDISNIDVDEDTDDTVTEAFKLDNSVKPVYIILTEGSTPIISDGIRLFTHSNITHVSISFDEEIKEVYSFNMKNSKFGFVHEKIANFKDNIIHVYVFLTEPSIYEKFIETINDYRNNKSMYDLRIFVAKVLNINKSVSDNKYNQVCSTFVNTLLKSGGIDLFADNALPAPVDFEKVAKTRTNQFFLLFKGRVSEYNFKKIRPKVRYIYKKHKLVPFTYTNTQ